MDSLHLFFYFLGLLPSLEPAHVFTGLMVAEPGNNATSEREWKHLLVFGKLYPREDNADKAEKENNDQPTCWVSFICTGPKNCVNHERSGSGLDTQRHIRDKLDKYPGHLNRRMSSGNMSERDVEAQPSLKMTPMQSHKEG